MKHQLVLRQGLLSEKIYNQMESGIYTFLVNSDSTKNDVRKAVEGQFNVKVTKVNISKKPSKKKRVTETRKVVNTGAGKKAVVYLKSGDRITMLSPKQESKKKNKDKKEEAKATKKLEDTKVEGKGLFSRITKSKNKKGEEK